VFVIFAYSSYMLAQGVGASGMPDAEPHLAPFVRCIYKYDAVLFGRHPTGIVAMLFAGIAMSHYTFPNLSAESQVTTKGIFRVRPRFPVASSVTSVLDNLQRYRDKMASTSSLVSLRKTLSSRTWASRCLSAPTTCIAGTLFLPASLCCLFRVRVTSSRYRSSPTCSPVPATRFPETTRS